MAKVVYKRSGNTTSSLFHCGLIKIILTHELQKKSLSWKKFVVHCDNEAPEEQLGERMKEDEILMLTYIEDEIEDPEETSSKQPQRRVRTRSMVKEDLQSQEKDKNFTTYERNSRKHKYGHENQATEINDEEQQRHYVYIQSLESEEEDPIEEIGQSNEEVNIIFDQEKAKEKMELDAQTIEKTPVNKQEQDDGNIAIISPISKQKERKNSQCKRLTN